MPIMTLCVHGNAFYSEQYLPGNLDFDGRPVLGPPVIDPGLPRGWGRTFSATGWYHAAVPAVSYFDGQPMHVDEVMILTSSAAMSFSLAHLWEGGNFLWTGPASVSSATNLLLRPRDAAGRRFQLRSGLGVSLFFTNAGGGFVTFHSASATLRSEP